MTKCKYNVNAYTAVVTSTMQYHLQSKHPQANKSLFPKLVILARCYIYVCVIREGVFCHRSNSAGCAPD